MFSRSDSGPVSSPRIGWPSRQDTGISWSGAPGRGPSTWTLEGPRESIWISKAGHSASTCRAGRSERSVGRSSRSSRGREMECPPPGSHTCGRRGLRPSRQGSKSRRTTMIRLCIWGSEVLGAMCSGPWLTIHPGRSTRTGTSGPIGASQGAAASRGPSGQPAPRALPPKENPKWSSSRSRRRPCSPPAPSHFSTSSRTLAQGEGDREESTLRAFRGSRPSSSWRKTDTPTSRVFSLGYPLGGSEQPAPAELERTGLRGKRLKAQQTRPRA